MTLDAQRYWSSLSQNMSARETLKKCLIRGTVDNRHVNLFKNIQKMINYYKNETNEAKRKEF